VRLACLVINEVVDKESERGGRKMTATTTKGAASETFIIQQDKYEPNLI
jgi:hypothetical protein